MFDERGGADDIRRPGRASASVFAKQPQLAILSAAEAAT